MTFSAIILTLLFGGVVGVTSGLIGIGGGVLMVPFLYLLFSSRGSGVQLDPDLHAVVAHATSLGVILPTAVRGVFSYQKASLVRWEVVVPMGLGAALAAIIGSRITPVVPGDFLKFAFGLLLVITGVRLLSRGPRHGKTRGGVGEVELRLGFGAMLAAGLVVGFLSALMGVGGGAVAIPILISLVGLPLRYVTATSLGIICFAALSGASAYALTGGLGLGVGEGRLGYLYWPATLALAPGAVAGAPLGAYINQRLGAERLQHLFGIFFLILGAIFVWTMREAIP